MRKERNEALKRFGRAIRTLRKARGFSQEGLALEADINRTYMGGLERGEENVSLLTILKLCAVLKVDASKILLEASL
jgi:transcriptional regulator with XRE-family HTH domain